MTAARSPALWPELIAAAGVPVLAIRGLSKAFGANEAVREVDLSVEPGAFLGLVGPNGAGKTTLLSMAVGLLRPDQGNAWVAGHPVWPSSGSGSAKQLLGVLPDGLALPRQLTGRELLTYLGLLRAMPAAVVAARVDELLSVLDFDHVAVLDHGQVRRAGTLAQVRAGPSLEEAFAEIVGTRPPARGLSWFGS
jgi:ABC-2 type transport system ATP-binding protein